MTVQNAGVVTLTLDTLTKRHIEGVLAVAHGRIEGPYGAAAILKINPHTLPGTNKKAGYKLGVLRLRK